MDPQAKQKVMVGVLAVLIIGAGSYYMFFAGGDSSQQQTADTGPVEIKQRKVETTQTKARPTTRASGVRDAEEAPAERAERVREDRDEATTRTRGTSGSEKKVKVKRSPAA